MKLLPCRRRNHYTHGHTSNVAGKRFSPTYQSWMCMRNRCRLKSRHNNEKYRKLGYSVEWDSFETFLSDMGNRPDGTTLDRIDGSKGYSRENCRWANATQQARNRTGKTNKITYDQALAMIRMRLDDGCKYSYISKSFGVSETLPSEIVNGRAWADAMEQYNKENWNKRIKPKKAKVGK